MAKLLSGRFRYILRRKKVKKVRCEVCGKHVTASKIKRHMRWHGPSGRRASANSVGVDPVVEQLVESLFDSPVKCEEPLVPTPVQDEVKTADPTVGGLQSGIRPGSCPPKATPGLCMFCDMPAMPGTNVCFHCECG